MSIRAIFAVLFSVCIFFCTSSSAFADENAYSDITTDQKIINTLNTLKIHSSQTKQTLNIIMGDNLSNKPMKVMFYDFSMLGSSFENMDAVACKKRNSDRIFILINNIHQNAPVEALASLLTHETLHQDDVSSIEEETTGWTNEAKTWVSFKQTNSRLNNIDSESCPLVKRLNTLSEMYSAANNTSEKIAKSVRSNEGYSSLAEYSPGYGI